MIIPRKLKEINVLYAYGLKYCCLIVVYLFAFEAYQWLLSLFYCYMKGCKSNKLCENKIKIHIALQ